MTGQTTEARLEKAAAERVLVVVAHPDDETIGAGARLRRLRRAHVAFVTDGAPRDGRDARARGFGGPADYARARRSEALAALALAGLPDRETTWLDVPDKDAIGELPALARSLRSLLLRLAPTLVLTHPYEGGHPDHDAAAFAVHAGVRLLAGQGVAPPTILELASYHAASDRSEGVRRLEFLPPLGPVFTDLLNDEDRMCKRQMLACYATQRDVLCDFPDDVERFRPAPAYRFTAPPHPGRLHYESFGWGVNGADFCAAARHALSTLALSPL